MFLDAKIVGQPTNIMLISIEWKASNTHKKSPIKQRLKKIRSKRNSSWNRNDLKILITYASSQEASKFFSTGAAIYWASGATALLKERSSVKDET